MAKQKRKTNTNARTSASRNNTGDKMKDMFDQFGALPNSFEEITRSNIEAFTKSAETFGKGMAEMNTKAIDFMQTNIKRNFEAARSLGSVRSAEDFSSIQEITKTGFQAYVEQMNEMSALFASTMRGAAEPLSAQAGAVVEKFQTSA